jgi:hypothetical protein
VTGCGQTPQQIIQPASTTCPGFGGRRGALYSFQREEHVMPDIIEQLLHNMWRQYVQITPQALRVHQLLAERGEQVVNDHIALRTFDQDKLNIQQLAQSFLRGGYRQAGEYDFPEKKLSAHHYEHDDPQKPRIFISELRLGECHREVQRQVGELIDQVPEDLPRRWDFCMCGRPWQVSHQTYEALAAHSEYAAWMAAFGFRANHFTVNVNHLRTFNSLEELNDLLLQNGFELNDSGGLIKGSPEVFLEQSSTLAEPTPVTFTDGTYMVPGCYYEFARRYPLPDGQLFPGFVAKSADKIFESTDRRGRPSGR